MKLFTGVRGVLFCAVLCINYGYAGEPSDSDKKSEKSEALAAARQATSPRRKRRRSLGAAEISSSSSSASAVTEPAPKPRLEADAKRAAGSRVRPGPYFNWQGRPRTQIATYAQGFAYEYWKKTETLEGLKVFTFSPDGSVIALVRDYIDDSYLLVEVRHIMTGELLKTWIVEDESGFDAESLVFSSNGRFLALASRARVVLLDSFKDSSERETWIPLSYPQAFDLVEEEELLAVAFGPENVLAVVSSGRMRIWDRDTLRQWEEILFGTAVTSQVIRAEVSSDLQSAAIACIDGSVYILDRRKRSSISALRSPSSGGQPLDNKILGLKWYQNGMQLLVVGATQIEEWDVRMKKLVRSFNTVSAENFGPVMNLVLNDIYFTAPSSWAVALQGDVVAIFIQSLRVIKFWNVSSTRFLGELSLSSMVSQDCGPCVFGPHGYVIGIADNNVLWFLNNKHSKLYVASMLRELDLIDLLKQLIVARLKQSSAVGKLREHFIVRGKTSKTIAVLREQLDAARDMDQLLFAGAYTQLLVNALMTKGADKALRVLKNQRARILQEEYQDLYNAVQREIDGIVGLYQDLSVEKAQPTPDAEKIAKINETLQHIASYNQLLLEYARDLFEQRQVAVSPAT